MNTRDIARKCRRWSSCSVNNCPLDPHPKYLADKETKCPMEKPVRLRIAAELPGRLPMGGLTKLELAAKLTFERKPVADRIAMVEAGKAALRNLHATAERTMHDNT
jgi:hypothetical protein